MRIIKTSFDRMKAFNKLKVLNTLREHSPITRKEVSELLDLTPPTVTNQMKEFFDLGIVKLTSEKEVSGGRKAHLYTFNGEAKNVIGLEINPTGIRAGLGDLSGTILDTYYYSPTIQYSNESLLDTVEEVVRKMLKSAKRDVVGIGIGMHGLVDSKHGISVFAPHFGLHQLPLQQLLEERLHIPVEIDNDNRVMALAEKNVGAAKQWSSFLVAQLSTGIGSAFYNNGVYYGSRDRAGELGHTVVDLQGPKCVCGNFGCLETYASISALQRQADVAVRLGQKTVLHKLSEGGQQKITLDMLIRGAEQEDAYCLQLFEQVGRYLGISFANLFNLFDPDGIVLGGYALKVASFIMPTIKDIVSRHVYEGFDEYNIVLTPLGLDSPLIGGCFLAIESYLEKVCSV